MPKRIDPEVKARAVRLVTEHQREYPSQTAAITAVAHQVGVSAESLRRWVVQDAIDVGDRPGVSSEENERSSGCGRRTVGCVRTSRS